MLRNLNRHFEHLMSAFILDYIESTHCFKNCKGILSSGNWVEFYSLDGRIDIKRTGQKYSPTHMAFLYTKLDNHLYVCFALLYTERSG